MTGIYAFSPHGGNGNILRCKPQLCFCVVWGLGGCGRGCVRIVVVSVGAVPSMNCSGGVSDAGFDGFVVSGAPWGRCCDAPAGMMQA